MPAPLYTLNAVQVLSLLKSNNVTVQDYAQSLLHRIHERNNTVEAWAYLDNAFVLDQAQALDRVPQHKRGPLHGIAIGVKDTMNTKDMPTQFGSPIYEGHRPGFDSSAVAILRAAGALIFGKTTTTEFTVTNSGPNTTNPHDPNRTPGGSSCGSAAAVADMQVPLSLGAQTGGSIIRPASFSGVFAMKPTHDAISTEGQKAFAPTFDTFGFFARSIEDLQLLADVFALHDDEPPGEVPIEQVSVALIKTPLWASAGPGTIAAVDEATKILMSCGAHVEEVSFPSEVSDAQALKRIQKVITEGEAQATFLREYRVDKTKLAPEICRLVENASNYTKKERVQAYDTYANMRRIVDNIAEKYSVILTPSAIDEAPLGLGDMGSATFNTLWTASLGFHMPVINIPAFRGPNDMPIGVSLVAPRYRDQHLLKVSQILGDAMAQNAYKKQV
ncbi:hypothetical protein O1611_g892 [Lasiodiplodia mahajangana]|uniref:Uncharacterized protein n=1 Tax=Lasiodiplodia mahajangana TaxID=1108764 RepID=A0ACC2JZ27_9PEZI|nr:hypothetical protein O1611_g892 [Lasiodiplodia mahajangana]